MKTLAKIGVAVVVAACIAGAVNVYASGNIEHKSILSGTVVSVVAPGTEVHEGDVLVMVTSLAGPVPAARAESDGVVKEVLVTKGQNLAKQDVVAVIAAR